LNAKLEEISADTITDERGERFYRIRVRTRQSYITHNGKKLPIIPGMTAQVDIVTGKKTVLQYLLKPFNKIRRKALREK
jgi:adhesin transport system membrane fusion protein